MNVDVVQQTRKLPQLLRLGSRVVDGVLEAAELPAVRGEQVERVRRDGAVEPAA